MRRDANGKIVKAIFVCEGYDYFSELFDDDPDRVVEIYRDFTETNTITTDDLRAVKGIASRNGLIARPGGFNPRNRFNINPGIVHLSHRANALSAEVTLAGVSGILRLKADGSLLAGTDPEELLCCNEGGDPNRNSDPLISQQAYALVKGGWRYTLANPVGLYIAAVERDRVQTKDGDQLTDEWWKVIRGDGFADQATSRVLRLELAPPAGSNLTLEDLEVDGVPVRFGAQLASLLLVHLFVTRWRRDEAMAPLSISCTGTGCRVIGSPQIIPTRDTCGDGTQLAFPGLIPIPGGDSIGPASAKVAVAFPSGTSSNLRTRR